MEVELHLVGLLSYHLNVEVRLTRVVDKPCDGSEISGINVGS